MFLRWKQRELKKSSRWLYNTKRSRSGSITESLRVHYAHMRWPSNKLNIRRTEKTIFLKLRFFKNYLTEWSNLTSKLKYDSFQFSIINKIFLKTKRKSFEWKILKKAYNCYRLLSIVDFLLKRTRQYYHNVTSSCSTNSLNLLSNNKIFLHGTVKLMALRVLTNYMLLTKDLFVQAACNKFLIFGKLINFYLAGVRGSATMRTILLNKDYAHIWESSSLSKEEFNNVVHNKYFINVQLMLFNTLVKCSYLNLFSKFTQEPPSLFSTGAFRFSDSTEIAWNKVNSKSLNVVPDLMFDNLSTLKTNNFCYWWSNGARRHNWLYNKKRLPRKYVFYATQKLKGRFKYTLLHDPHQSKIRATIKLLLKQRKNKPLLIKTINEFYKSVKSVTPLSYFLYKIKKQLLLTNKFIKYMGRLNQIQPKKFIWHWKKDTTVNRENKFNFNKTKNRKLNFFNKLNNIKQFYSRLGLTKIYSLYSDEAQFTDRPLVTEQQGSWKKKKKFSWLDQNKKIKYNTHSISRKHLITHKKFESKKIPFRVPSTDARKYTLIIKASRNNWFISLTNSITGELVIMRSSGWNHYKTTQQKRAQTALFSCLGYILEQYTRRYSTTLQIVKIMQPLSVSQTKFFNSWTITKIWQAITDYQIKINYFKFVLLRTHGWRPRRAKLRRK